jgi:hypothetical protein
VSTRILAKLEDTNGVDLLFKIAANVKPFGPSAYADESRAFLAKKTIRRRLCDARTFGPPVCMCRIEAHVSAIGLMLQSGVSLFR